MKSLICKVRLFGTLVRSVRSLDQPLGTEITVRIILNEGHLFVDRQNGVDGTGRPRWTAIEPSDITQASLCAALIEHAGEDLPSSSPAVG